MTYWHILAYAAALGFVYYAYQTNERLFAIIGGAMLITTTISLWEEPKLHESCLSGTTYYQDGEKLAVKIIDNKTIPCS